MAIITSEREILSAEKVKEWQNFWKKHGIFRDFSGITQPKIQEENDALRLAVDFSRELLIPRGLTANSIIGICQKRFPVWVAPNPFRPAKLISFRQNSRTAKCGSYVIKVRDRIEADEELPAHSGLLLEAKGILGITLVERLVYELKHFDETGRHLDLMHLTYCAGSRNKYDAPTVNFNQREVFIAYQAYCKCNFVDMRTRQVLA